MEAADKQMAKVDSGNVGPVCQEEVEELIVVELRGQLSDPSLDGASDDNSPAIRVGRGIV